MGRTTRRILAIAILMASLVAPSAAFALSAVPADHIGGGNATWTQSTDGIRTPTAFLPELLGFKYDLALTVFESPDTWARVRLPARIAAYRTGRLEPALYYHGGGQESGLVSQLSWYRGTFGAPPSALSYRDGFDGDKTFVPRYVLGARNSGWGFGTAYGASRESSATSLGAPPTDLTPSYTGSMPSTTRVFDAPSWSTLADGSPNPLFGLSLGASLDAADQALGQAIASRGWYSDFTHWSTPTGPQLYDYFSRQAAVMKASGVRVTRASYGDAVAHRFLRDSIACTASEPATGTVVVRTTFTPAYPQAPVSVVRQPVTVVLETAGSSLEGSAVAAVGAQVERLATDRYALLIPFSASGSTVTVRKTAATAYRPTTPPIVSGSVSGGILSITTSRPTNVALFVASADLSHAPAADVVWRSTSVSGSHRIDLRSPGQAPSAGASVVAPGQPVALWAGAIGAEGHSTAVRVTAPTSAARFATGWVGSPAYRVAATLGARLTDAAYAPLPRQAVSVDRFTGSRWVKVTAATPVTGQPGRYSARVLPYAGKRTVYRFRYGGLSGTYASAVSAGVAVVPQVGLSAPSLDRTPRRGERFAVRGLLAPRHAEGTKPVVLEFYRYERTAGGTRHYVRRRSSVSPWTTDALGGSRYSTRVSVPYAGHWLVRAVHPADGTHAKTISPATKFSVR